jgi:hypothetical protein
MAIVSPSFSNSVDSYAMSNQVVTGYAAQIDPIRQ